MKAINMAILSEKLAKILLFDTWTDFYLFQDSFLVSFNFIFVNKNIF